MDKGKAPAVANTNANEASVSAEGKEAYSSLKSDLDWRKEIEGKVHAYNKRIENLEAGVEHLLRAVIVSHIAQRDHVTGLRAPSSLPITTRDHQSEMKRIKKDNILEVIKTEDEEKIFRADSLSIRVQKIEGGCVIYVYEISLDGHLILKHGGVGSNIYGAWAAVLKSVYPLPRTDEEKAENKLDEWCLRAAKMWGRFQPELDAKFGPLDKELDPDYLAHRNAILDVSRIPSFNAKPKPPTEPTEKPKRESLTESDPECY